jgi:hypothetical protein
MRAVPLAQRVSTAPEKAGKPDRAVRADKARKPGRAAATKRRSDAAWVTPACVSDGGPHVSHRSCAF